MMAKVYSGAGIRIIGRELRLDEISRELGLVASHSHRAGELDKFGELYPQDMWLLESPLGKQKHLDMHLKWLAQELKPKYDYLKRLKTKTKTKIDVFCSYTGMGDGGLSLSPQALSIFAELGIKLELSIILLRPKK